MQGVPLLQQHAVELLVGDGVEGVGAEGVAVAVLGRGLEAFQEVAGSVVEAIGVDLVEVRGDLLDLGRAVVLRQQAPELQEAVALGLDVLRGEHGVHEDTL